MREIYQTSIKEQRHRYHIDLIRMRETDLVKDSKGWLRPRIDKSHPKSYKRGIRE